MTKRQQTPAQATEQSQGFHYLGVHYQRAENIPGLGRTKAGKARLVVSDEVFFGGVPMPTVSTPEPDAQ